MLIIEDLVSNIIVLAAACWGFSPTHSYLSYRSNEKHNGGVQYTHVADRQTSDEVCELSDIHNTLGPARWARGFFWILMILMIAWLMPPTLTSIRGNTHIMDDSPSNQ